MTTIAAIARGGTVWMAADSVVNVFERPIPGGVRKLVRPAGTKQLLIGVAGAAGLPELLHTELQITPTPPAGHQLDSWASQLARDITRLALAHGLVDQEDGRMDAHLLLGYAGKVWTINHAAAIAHPDGIAAVGSGEGPAMGAMDALLLHTQLPPGEVVCRAVEFACRRDRFSAPPVLTEVLDG